MIGQSNYSSLSLVRRQQSSHKLERRVVAGVSSTVSLSLVIYLPHDSFGEATSVAQTASLCDLVSAPPQLLYREWLIIECREDFELRKYSIVVVRRRNCSSMHESVAYPVEAVMTAIGIASVVVIALQSVVIHTHELQINHRH